MTLLVLHSFAHVAVACFFSLFFSEGGFFKAHLTFPKEYPIKPPKLKFVSDVWHPNSMYFVSIDMINLAPFYSLLVIVNMLIDSV